VIQAAAGNVARTKDYIMTLDRRYKLGKFFRLVRKISVHLTDQIASVSQHVFKPADISAPQTKFTAAMKHTDAIRKSRGEFIGNSPSPIRAVIVDHENPQVLQWQRAQAID